VQIEGVRLLLTLFPQEEFNQTEDRKVDAPSLGVACLDCHANFHTNAAFHLTISRSTRPETLPTVMEHLEIAKEQLAALNSALMPER
jgi:hypothetical protein